MIIIGVAEAAGIFKYIFDAVEQVGQEFCSLGITEQRPAHGNYLKQKRRNPNAIHKRSQYLIHHSLALVYSMPNWTIDWEVCGTDRRTILMCQGLKTLASNLWESVPLTCHRWIRLLMYQ